MIRHLLRRLAGASATGLLLAGLLAAPASANGHIVPSSIGHFMGSGMPGTNLTIHHLMLPDKAIWNGGVIHMSTHGTPGMNGSVHGFGMPGASDIPRPCATVHVFGTLGANGHITPSGGIHRYGTNGSMQYLHANGIVHF